MVQAGLAKLGYEYVIIDAGWQQSTRDEHGLQQANTTKFPTGIKSLANYVHSRGLKLGLYRYAFICFPLSQLMAQVLKRFNNL